MENLKTIKDRIRAIGNLVKATNAIKMVSTVKLSKLNNFKKLSRECSDVLLKMLTKIIVETRYKQLFETDHWLNRTSGKTLIIVLSSDQGFCGPFNQMIVEKSRELLRLHSDALIEIYGKKAAILAQNSKIGVANINKIEKKDDYPGLAHTLADTIFHHIVEDGMYEVHIISGKFKDVLTQKAQCTKLFPVDMSGADVTERVQIDGNKVEMVFDLFKEYLLVTLSGILIEHRVAEYSARILATDGSVRNADTLLEKLKTAYNSTRQMKITQELTEIISSIECVQ